MIKVAGERDWTLFMFLRYCARPGFPNGSIRNVHFFVVEKD